ncbi:conjugative transposon protein TraM [Dyadobacter pollutisoli]|uniref:Conjugative transposon protein TraM n=1 Tax=Dyadobacter pollutisoli TaxID=2910158 RepID=A0A9E8NE02_9BACT|nr:conjugative transposon protein TraM [Dyadobacter pollutisoli]WAC13251.1 conjugative transposon protein TraM [Dyadobacter pollutisoli]
MENQLNESAAQRRFYLLMPVIVLPFLTVIYWLVVIKNMGTNLAEASSKGGLLTSLPAASPQEGDPVSKLEFYHKAEQDSAARLKQIKKDPYRQGAPPEGADSLRSRLMGLEGSMAKNKKGKPLQAALLDEDHPETRLVKQRLAALDRALAAAQSPAFDQASPVAPEPEPKPEAPTTEQFDAMMQDLQAQASEQPADPELDKLDSMLDKIMQIQDPHQKEAGTAAQPAKAAYTATAAAQKDPVTLMDVQSPDSLSGLASHASSAENGFFSLDQTLPDAVSAGITAVVSQDQQLITGSIIRLRLTSPMLVAGVTLPEHTLLYGTVTLAGERLQVEISSIHIQNQLLPVKLSVYDQDGLSGIYIPGALSRVVAKQQISQDIQGYDLDIAGTSAGVQAASAAVQTAKTFLSRKTRLVQVKVPDGYQVLLKDLNSPLP